MLPDSDPPPSDYDKRRPRPVSDWGAREELYPDVHIVPSVHLFLAFGHIFSARRPWRDRFIYTVGLRWLLNSRLQERHAQHRTHSFSTVSLYLAFIFSLTMHWRLTVISTWGCAGYSTSLWIDFWFLISDTDVTQRESPDCLLFFWPFYLIWHPPTTNTTVRVIGY